MWRNQKNGFHKKKGKKFRTIEKKIAKKSNVTIVQDDSYLVKNPFSNQKRA